jgi:hypothetical protein
VPPHHLRALLTVVEAGEWLASRYLRPEEIAQGLPALSHRVNEELLGWHALLDPLCVPHEASYDVFPILEAAVEGVPLVMIFSIMEGARRNEGMASCAALRSNVRAGEPSEPGPLATVWATLSYQRSGSRTFKSTFASG